MKQITLCLSLIVLPISTTFSFSSSFTRHGLIKSNFPSVITTPAPKSKLHMNLDPVTSLRTEWISAALCTNQTPRSANIALQIGTYDGRAVTFLPRTIRSLLTSSTESDGTLSISCQRILNQMRERRFGKEEDLTGGMKIELMDQRADDLKLVEDDSVDVVVMLQTIEKMEANGLDWKKSVREALRVMKPGTGRLLFVEKTDTGYLQYLEEFEGTILEEVGYDDVDLVLTPHVAGVAIKREDAGLSEAEIEAKRKMKERDLIAERSLQAFERGSKRKRKRKKKAEADEAAEGK